MAGNADIKAATTFPARADNLFYPLGKAVGNGALTRFANALKASYPFPGGGAWPAGRPDANDAAAWLYKQAAGFVKQCERRVAEAAVAQPSKFEN